MVSSKKALLAGVLASVVLAQSAFGAEKDGVFVGVELGANKVKFKQTLDYVMNGMIPISGDIKADNLMPSLAVKGGYKWFFGAQRNFGVRAYGQVGVGYGRLVNVEYSDSLKGLLVQMNQHLGTMVQAAANQAASSIFTGTGKTYYTTFIDYFIGADLLYNFTSKNDDITWGVYAGVGVGGVTWAANGKEYEVSNGKRSYTNFAANANLGLRVSVKENHEIDLGARTYFPKSKLFKASNGTSPLIPPQTPAIVKDTKTYHYRPFSVVLSYIYNF